MPHRMPRQPHPVIHCSMPTHLLALAAAVVLDAAAHALALGVRRVAVAAAVRVVVLGLCAALGPVARAGAENV